MTSSHHADPSAPANYAPSVPMSVYRELAAELRANKAVIDSLNSRNQQLLQQNQFLKKEIHTVVQATLNLGQAAGITRQALKAGGAAEFADSFPSKIAPETLAKLMRAEASPDSQAVDTPPSAIAPPSASLNSAPPRPVSAPPQNRVPRPIPAKTAVKRQGAFRRTESVPSKGTMPQVPPGKLVAKPKGKLFTEQSGEYRSSILESQENKEMGGIWLILSIVLIIVTAFGAGFLIMKPLLNDR
ncbi:MAG: hypothetical protein WBD47_00655 [Phormidesmis sp.]